MFKRSSPGGSTSWTSDNYNVRLSSSECGTGAQFATYDLLIVVDILVVIIIFIIIVIIFVNGICITIRFSTDVMQSPPSVCPSVCLSVRFHSIFRTD